MQRKYPNWLASTYDGDSLSSSNPVQDVRNTDIWIFHIYILHSYIENPAVVVVVVVVDTSHQSVRFFQIMRCWSSNF